MSYTISLTLTKVQNHLLQFGYKRFPDNDNAVEHNSKHYFNQHQSCKISLRFYMYSNILQCKIYAKKQNANTSL